MHMHMNSKEGILETIDRLSSSIPQLISDQEAQTGFTPDHFFFCVVVTIAVAIAEEYGNQTEVARLEKAFTSLFVLQKNHTHRRPKSKRQQEIARGLEIAKQILSSMPTEDLLKCVSTVSTSVFEGMAFLNVEAWKASPYVSDTIKARITTQGLGKNLFPES